MHSTYIPGVLLLLLTLYDATMNGGRHGEVKYHGRCVGPRLLDVLTVHRLPVYRRLLLVVRSNRLRPYLRMDAQFCLFAQQPIPPVFLGEF